ncbi:hypothetical protein AJ79_09228 [Helicocarpus griseus UAMH5409]|uniref:Aminoglycoside phosphotransferase domain-containing protein n=1 Tax=Helicocarpus griseus UAMH5409 TaxID=1447875 RepID=A0A2B7WLH2_9EURO|nr:hypothetical protein AJ79_09228 [Helicocarpus griseus UAMH5409]
MVRTRHLRRGQEVTYSWAKTRENNLLIALDDYDQTRRYFNRFIEHSALIQQAVAHHLGISPKECELDEASNWMSGSYNLCIPVLVRGQKQVLMRFPILHRVGESFRPGNADEKIQCEAGTYAWLKENCSSVPVPRLYGFALSTGQTYTAAENLPWLPRYFHYIRCRILKLFGHETPSSYVRHQGPCVSNELNIGYLLIEYINKSDATMLSSSWEAMRHNKHLRTNLFKGLSRILLNVAKVPVPRIGSYIIDDNGFVVLANRPLSMEIHELESQHIPVNIPRDKTYSSVDSYVIDTLAFHDNRLIHQPNALNDPEDGAYQAAALAAMRTVAMQFFKHGLRCGPFVYVLNDLHQSNILVDEEWNIKYLIDLEWACSRPIEMLHPPHWLTSQAVDMIDVNLFTSVHQEFTSIMQQEESDIYKDTTISLSDVMNQGWESKTFWYALALTSPTGIFAIFFDRIRPMFAKYKESAFIEMMHRYWISDVGSFLEKKMEDKAAYDLRLQEEFDVYPAT